MTSHSEWISENYKLSDVLEIKALQDLMDSFIQLVPVSLAVIDPDGTVIASAGQQQICAKFHQVNSLTFKNCLQSQTKLSDHLSDGEFKMNKCQNGLWELITPINSGGHFLGNLFMGQFMFDNDAVDYDFFNEQIKKYDFDQERYLAALNKVPRLSHEQIESAKSFFIMLAKTISRLGFQNISLSKALSQLKKAEENAKYQSFLVENVYDAVVASDRNLKLTFWNTAAENIYGWKKNEVLGKNGIQILQTRYLDNNLNEIIASSIKNNGSVTEVIHKHKDGHDIYIESHYKVLLDKNGEIEQYISVNRDISDRKKIEAFQKFLITAGWENPEVDFFKSLAKYLGETLGIDYVCIDKLLGSENIAQTVAIYYDGKFEDNIIYSLQDTPCGEVVGSTICSYSSSVRKLFPKDEFLQTMKAESYIGTTLWSSAGKPIGLIALIFRRPHTNMKITETILKLVSQRAAGELERMQVIENLRKSEASLTTAQSIANIGSYEWNIETGEFHWSDQMYKIHEKEKGKFIPTLDSILRLLHPDDRANFRDIFKYEKLKHTSFSGEYRIITEKSGVRILSSKSKVQLNREGQPYRYVGAVLDITEQRKNEEDLKILARFPSENPNVVFRVNSDGILLYANPVSKEIINDWKCKPGQKVPLFISQLIEEARETGKRLEFEYSTKGKIYLFYVALIKGENYINLYGQDITIRKKAELALLEVNETLEMKVKERTAELSNALSALVVEKKKFKDLLDLIPAYVCLLTQDYEISYANRLFVEYFGEPRDLKCYKLLFNGDQPCENCESFKVLNTNKTHYWEWTGPNGRIYNIIDYPFVDHDGKALILEMGLDITEKRRMQQSILSASVESEEKERRRIASDLHDDLGPMLCIIKLNIDLLLKGIHDDKQVETIKTSSRLLEETITKVRNISGHLLPRIIENFGIDAAIDSFLDSIKLDSKIQVHFTSNLFERRLPGDMEIHLYRIITELVNNTIKHAGASSLQIEFTLKDSTLKVFYSDNGKGYKINMPYHDHKGLGIYNIIHRVELLKGKIEFVDVKHKTVVQIRIEQVEA